MMKFRNITQKFKKLIYKRSNLYSNPIVNLEMEGRNLVLKCKTDKFFRNSSIIIKHRITGNVIKKYVDNGRVIVSLDELLNLGFVGIFDFYFEFESELIRIKSDSQKNINVEFDDKKCVLKSYTTKFGNLSLNLKRFYFTYVLDSIEAIGDEVIFSGNFDFIHEENDSEFFIEIKNRLTGKMASKKIESNTVVFSLDEILSLDESPFFDLYLKLIKGNFLYKKRVEYDYDFEFFKAISKNRSKILYIVSTRKNNFSFKQESKYFDCNISSLKSQDNELVIKGQLDVIDDEITKIDKICIVIKNRLNGKSHLINLDYSIDDSKYVFEGKIGKLDFGDEKVINLRLDFYLRVYDDDIYYQDLIDVRHYTSYKNKENKYLVKIPYEDNVYSYYATDKKHSLALWITTENSWNKSYEIAKGKTIYENTLAQYELDDKIIFFESFFGKSYSGNPKYIYEAMLKLGMDKEFTFVWSYSGQNKDEIPGNPIIVDRYKAGDYYKYLALAKYWINNIIFPIHIKRKGNIYLQTWHGTPLKKLGFDITIPGPEVDARKNFYNESRNWDFLVSSNSYSTEIFKRAFRYDNNVLELGYPINDIFFKNNDELITAIKSKLEIANKKVILYAPTWKDDEQNENWEHYFNLDLDLNKLYNELGDDYVILLKMHHLVSENFKIDDNLKDFVFDVSDWEDIQELYIVSDILITDYSSVFFDYAHSRRPILFFVPDLEHYISDVRGLYLNMKKDLPGPIIKDNEALISSIKNIEDVKKEYSEKYDEFYDKFCSLCKGQSGEDIVKKVFK